MLEFAKKCYGFIGRWFDIQKPLAVSIDDIFFEEATQKIFADGVFGLYNSDNIGNDVFNQIRHDNFHKLRMTEIALKKVFPSYKELNYHKQYAYLKKNKVLLPIAWIHRLFRMIKKAKTNIAFQGLRKSFISKKKINEREAIMRKWGL